MTPQVTAQRRGGSRGAQRVVIVNADDFGLSCGINRGIVDAHRHGIVTSTSLMVYRPGALEAARLAQEFPSLDVGLHVDLGEWLYREGEWIEAHQVVQLDDEAAVHREILEQVETFHQLMGRKPSHLDSHQHVHRRGHARRAMAQIGRSLRAPVRHLHPLIRYVGDFHGQTGRGKPLHQSITVEALLAVLEGLAPGINELACHPGYVEDLTSDYLHERELELETLCHREIRVSVRAHDLVLGTFDAVRQARQFSR